MAQYMSFLATQAMPSADGAARSGPCPAMRTQTSLDTSARNAATANDEQAPTRSYHERLRAWHVRSVAGAQTQFRVQGSAATARAAAPVSPGCNAQKNLSTRHRCYVSTNAVLER